MKVELLRSTPVTIVREAVPGLDDADVTLSTPSWNRDRDPAKNTLADLNIGEWYWFMADATCEIGEAGAPQIHLLPYVWQKAVWPYPVQPMSIQARLAELLLERVKGNADWFRPVALNPIKITMGPHQDDGKPHVSEAEVRTSLSILENIGMAPALNNVGLTEIRFCDAQGWAELGYAGWGNGGQLLDPPTVVFLDDPSPFIHYAHMPAMIRHECYHIWEQQRGLNNSWVKSELRAYAVQQEVYDLLGVDFNVWTAWDMSRRLQAFPIQGMP